MILTDFDRRQLTRKIFIVVLIGTLLFNLAVPKPANAFFQFVIGGLAVGEAAFYTAAILAGGYSLYEAYDSFKNESITSKLFKNVVGNQWANLSQSAKEGWATLEEGTRKGVASLILTTEQWRQAVTAGLTSFTVDRAFLFPFPLPGDRINPNGAASYTVSHDYFVSFAVLEFQMNKSHFALMPWMIMHPSHIEYRWALEMPNGEYMFGYNPPADATTFTAPKLSVSGGVDTTNLQILWYSRNPPSIAGLSYQVPGEWGPKVNQVLDSLPVMEGLLKSVYGGTAVSMPQTSYPTIPSTKDITKPVAIPVPVGALTVPGTLTLNPADVTTAIGTMTGAITAPINPTAPDWSATPSGKLNFEPLKMVGNTFTKKFPFSIPWDIMGQFAIFDVAPQTPIIKVDKQIPVFGSNMDMKFNIDFSLFNSIMPIARWFLIILFDLGMIINLRRFMPE
ncbi:hypothetical protein [Paenibacillus amylolyticus]|uniref:hypothetical protein n=1 Tax=Paenibacillus amylolyticus TaxID=1451 RepID=UPI00201D80A0|nr:hypothetical protein [Paenibacillus amylolyticus]MCL6664558.1 hypothetical protein [Paenibacillus amylolyticus]